MLFGLGAVIVVAAVVAAVVLVVVRPGAQRLEYSSLPAPCGMISAASLAKYLPDAKIDPQAASSSDSDRKGGCTWSSLTSDQSRALVMAVEVFGSSTGLTQAKQAYQRGQSTSPPSPSPSSLPKGFTFSKRSVTDLGDQATTMLVTGSGDLKSFPGAVALIVRSGNAVLTLAYDVYTITSGRTAMSTIAQRAAEIVMARDCLAALANPATDTATPAATSPATSSPGTPSTRSPSTGHRPRRPLGSSTPPRTMPARSYRRRPWLSTFPAPRPMGPRAPPAR